MFLYVFFIFNVTSRLSFVDITALPVKIYERFALLVIYLKR